MQMQVLTIKYFKRKLTASLSAKFRLICLGQTLIKTMLKIQL
jgi:hypothetical protein